jgi:hypothetical protein
LLALGLNDGFFNFWEIDMPNFANYDVITDGIKLLDAAGDTDENFSIGLDSNAHLGIRSVLSYMIDPGSTGVTFKMTILNSNIPTNSDQIFTVIVPPTTLPSQSSHMRQEVIDANVLKKVGNSLLIQVTAGRANFSDIVLMYKSVSAL